MNLKDLSEGKSYLSHRSLTLTQTHHILPSAHKGLFSREVIDMWQVRDATLIKRNSRISSLFFSIIELWQSCSALHYLLCWYKLSVFISKGCVWACLRFNSLLLAIKWEKCFPCEKCHQRERHPWTPCQRVCLRRNHNGILSVSELLMEFQEGIIVLDVSPNSLSYHCYRITPLVWKVFSFQTCSYSIAIYLTKY